METIGQRIEQVRVEKQLSKSDIWKGASLTSGVYSQWMNGQSLQGENLIKVARILGVLPDWLQTGKGDKYESQNSKKDDVIQGVSEAIPQYSDSIEIPLLAATGSMGNGSYNHDADMVINVLRVTKQWVEKTFHSTASISKLRFIHAIGDSMSPTFNDGDILLIDTGAKQVDTDSIYVLDAHDRLFIKRVRRRLDGTFEISSDNPGVKTVDILNGGNDVMVKGRVVWVWNGRRV
jgi:phage repressor protein C with HTH and peptisase S24 domain